MTEIHVPDTPKSVRETLCIAQARVRQSKLDQHRIDSDCALLQRLIDECERYELTETYNGPLGVSPENPCWPGSEVLGGTYDATTRAVRLHVRHPNGQEIVVVGYAQLPASARYESENNGN